MYRERKFWILFVPPRTDCMAKCMFLKTNRCPVKYIRVGVRVNNRFDIVNELCK